MTSKNRIHCTCRTGLSNYEVEELKSEKIHKINKLVPVSSNGEIVLHRVDTQGHINNIIHTTKTIVHNHKI